MRLSIGLIAAALIISGCTASPLIDGMNRVALTGATEPLPANYKDLLRHHLGLYRQTDLEISAPRPLVAATVGEPARWYVCVRNPAGSEAVHVISGGKLAGTIPGPAGDLCPGGAYEPLR